MTRKNQRLPLISKAIEEMIEQATVDALNESEQITGWFTMIDENLAVPFETTVLGVPVTVEGVDLNQSERMSRLVSLSSTIKMRGGFPHRRAYGQAAQSPAPTGPPSDHSRLSLP
jgi:Calcium binding